MDGIARVGRIRPLLAGIGVRAQLALVVSIAILPLLALLLFGAMTNRGLIRASAVTHARDLARFGADRQDDGFRVARDALTTLRGLPPAALAGRDGCRATLAAIGADHPQFDSIGLVDADGTISCLGAPFEPRPFEDQALLNAARAVGPGGFVTAKVTIGAMSRKPVVYVATLLAAPAHPGSGPTVAFAGLDLDWAARHAWDFLEQGGATLSLIDTSDSIVLARSGGQRGFVGASIVGTPLVSAMLANPRGGGAETVDVDGKERLFGFAPLNAGGGRGLMVAVGLSHQAVLGRADRRLAMAVAIALSTAVLAAGAAWLFADRTQLRALRALVEAARKLGAGDLGARAAMAWWQAAELRTLAATLGDMAGAIATAQASLAGSERQLRMLAENSTDMILLVEPSGRRLYASPACRTLLGFEPEEMLGMNTVEAIHPDDLGFLDNPRAHASEESTTVTYRMRRKDGRYVWVESISRTIPADGARPSARLVVVRDIDERVATEQRLRESESRYRYLTEHGADAVIQYDLDLARRYVSPACQDLLGYTPEEMLGVKALGAVHPDDIDRVAQTFQSVVSGRTERAVALNRIRRRDGVWIWVEGHLRILRDPATGAPSGIIASMRDVSARKEAEDDLAEANRRLEALAGQDGLTGLANRRTFDAALRREHLQAVAEGKPLAMIMIDVDRFKAFNDRYGHPSGDECLRRVARAIESALPWRGDLVARYGGEEFAALLPDTGETDAAVVADRARRAVLALAIDHDGAAARMVTISAGVAALGRDGSAEALVYDADRALYRAKHRGRNTVVCALDEDEEKPDAA